MKDLKKVFRRGYDQRRVLMLDNTPRKLEREYGNLLRIRDWTGDHRDREVARLAGYLETIMGEVDFRSIEKRGWQERLQ